MRKLLLFVFLILLYSKSIQAFQAECTLWNIGPSDIVKYEKQVNGKIKWDKNAGGDVLFFHSKDRQSASDECARINEETETKKNLMNNIAYCKRISTGNVYQSNKYLIPYKPCKKNIEITKEEYLNEKTKPKTTAYSLPKCNIYHNELSDDKILTWTPCYGRMTWENGAEYVGEFNDGKFEGEGIYTYANGQILEGLWKEGELIKEKKVASTSTKKKTETKKIASTSKDLEKLFYNNFQLYYERVFSLATNSYFCYYESAYKNGKKTTDFNFLKTININPNEDNPRPLVEFFHSDDFHNVVYSAINENNNYDLYPFNYEIQKNYRDSINQQNTTIKIRKNSYEFEIEFWGYGIQKVKFTPKNNKLIFEYKAFMGEVRKIKVVHNCIPQERSTSDEYVKSYTPEGMFGQNANLKKQSAQKVIYSFVKKKKQLGKNPAKAIRSIAYLEVLYNELLNDKSFDKKAINDIKNAVLSFRKSFNFEENLSVNEAIKRYWVLAFLVENGTSIKKEVSKDLLERKVALHNLKNSIAMVRSFIEYDTSLNKKNQSVNLKEKQKLSSLVEEISKILSSFKSYKNEVAPPKSQLAKDIDSAIDEYEKTYYFIYDNINNFKKTNKNDLLISSAYGLDLLYNLLGEAESKIPNSYELRLSKIDKKYLKKHKNTLSKLVSDTNNVKLSNYKNTLFYTQQLENVDFNAINMMKKLDDLDLGLDNINNALNNVELDSINIAELSVNNVESSIESLNNINTQSISASVEQSIEQSAQAVEQAVEEAAASIQEIYTLGDAMAEIHDEIAGYTWFEPQSLSEYLESRGVSGIVDSTTSFSEAVDLFNQDQGTNLSDEEALIMMAADVCQSDGMCTHPMLGW